MSIKSPDDTPDNAINIEQDDNEAARQSIVDESKRESEEDERKDIILSNMRARRKVHRTFWEPIFEVAKKDDSFVGGKQWPEKIKQEREEQGRPCLTYNLLPAFVRQITNKMRQERGRPKVIPVQPTGAGAKVSRIENISGNKDYAIADVMTGIIRNIEHLSDADQAYDTAGKHAVDHGFGFFYAINEFDVRDPFVQTLKIYRVKNSYSVTLDPTAKEADYSDAQDGFMEDRVPIKSFQNSYPGVSSSGTPGDAGADEDQWYTTDDIRIVQYFYIDYIDDEVLKLSNGMTVWNSQVKEILDDIKRDEGIFVVKDGEGNEMRQKVKRPVCKWIKATYSDILEEAVLPFSEVPIFIVTGDEVIIDGKVNYESAIRHAKDPQMSYNYWRTAAAETVALAPRVPWLVTAKQIQGHDQMWEKANQSNVPFLVYNHIEGVPPPQRTFPTNVAAAELQNATQDADDIQSIIGLFHASLGKESNEKSGKAIIARQNQGNTSTFQFPDNMRRAKNRCAKLMVEAIPIIMDSERIERIRLIDDTEDFVKINEARVDAKTGKVYVFNDLGVGMYDVIMDTSESYATQRQEAVDIQMELLKILGPERASNIVHLIVKNLGVPGSDDVYEILRKMLPDQLKSPEEREADLPKGITLDEQGQPVDSDGNPWSPPPTVEQQIAMKEQELRELQINADKEKATGVQAKAQADIEQAKADMAKVELELKNLQQVGDAENQVPPVDMGEITKIINEVMKEHEENLRAHGEAIDKKIEDAVIDALKRTKAYVNKQIPKTGDMSQLQDPKLIPKTTS